MTVLGNGSGPRAISSMEGLKRPLRIRCYAIPALVGLSGWAVLVITATVGPGLLRSTAVFAFTLICPGLAVVRLLPLRGFLERAVLSVALSMSLAALTAQAVAINGRWEPLRPGPILLALASLCTAAAALEVAREVKKQLLGRIAHSSTTR